MYEVFVKCKIKNIERSCEVVYIKLFILHAIAKISN